MMLMETLDTFQNTGSLAVAGTLTMTAGIFTSSTGNLDVNGSV